MQQYTRANAGFSL